MNRNLTALLLTGTLMGFACAAARAEPVVAKPGAAAGKNSLDDQLRRRLDQDLLEGLGDVLPPDGKAQPAANNTKENEGPARSALDEKLLDDLGEPGAATAPPQDPLARIGANMRKSEKLIAGQNTSEQTQQLQQGIVKELAELIKELEKQAQCQGGQCQKPGQASSAQQAKQPGQPKPGESKPGQSPASQSSNKPAAESTAELRERDAKPVETATIEHARRQAWGNLPERVRQQLQNTASEEFLPQYTSQIEDYFKRLAELPPK